MQTAESDQDPVFYQPKTLITFSNLANIWAWLSLIVAVLFLVFEVFTLDSRIMVTNTGAFPSMDGHWWEWRNLTSPIVLQNIFSVTTVFMSMVGSFFLFKSTSIGLNVLLELGLTMESNAEETENE